MPPVLLGIPWPALGGPLRNHFWKKRRPQPYWGGERILETLWKPQMPWIIGLGASQPYSRGKFQETLWERFRGLSGKFPEFLPESPSRTGGMAQTWTYPLTRMILLMRNLTLYVAEITAFTRNPLTKTSFSSRYRGPQTHPELRWIMDRESFSE